MTELHNYEMICARYTPYGKFELWESKLFGDEVPCIVTLEGTKVGETFDSLNSFVKEYLEI